MHMKNKSKRLLNLVNLFPRLKKTNRILLLIYSGSNRNLVGDRSRTYLLPRCLSRKHADLACISAETVGFLSISLI
jgi:hypothetical protein